MENYAEAALRHWRDAILLEQNSCVDNADHHYGFAAECAIKKVLVILPGFSNQGELPHTYKTHIDLLWDRVALQSIQKAAPSLVAVLKTTNHFQSWNVNQRYAANGTVSQAVMKMHKNAASRLLGASGLTGGGSV